MSKSTHIAIEEAAKQLGVTRSTMYYYRKQLGIEYKKFPLDKHKYLTQADFERIQQARQAAAEGRH